MAQNLKIGDFVTVNKPFVVPQDSEAYKAGLVEVKEGDTGRIVRAAAGHMVVAEFDGKEVTIARRRLEPTKAPKRPGRPRKTAMEERPAASTGKLAFVNYSSPDFVTDVANTLLMHGGQQAGEDAVVVEIKLSELPKEVQQQIQALMRAKLDLRPQVGKSTERKNQIK